MFRGDKLYRVAVAGGVVTLGFGLYFTSRIQKNFREQGFYTKCLELMDGYPPAVDLLGKPIKVGRLDLGNRKLTYTDGYNARVAIPMKGTKHKGTLHGWASRYKLGDSWRINKLDLNVEHRQWTFFIHPDARERFSITENNAPVEPELLPVPTDGAESVAPVSETVVDHDSNHIGQENKDLVYLNIK